MDTIFRQVKSFCTAHNNKTTCFARCNMEQKSVANPGALMDVKGTSFFTFQCFFPFVYWEIILHFSRSEVMGNVGRTFISFLCFIIQFVDCFMRGNVCFLHSSSLVIIKSSHLSNYSTVIFCTLFETCGGRAMFKNS